MKFLFLLILSALSANPVFADDAANNAKQAEMMKKFEAAATPGAPHKRLASMAGKWTYTSKFWQSAEAKPEESKGTSNIKMILGGRFMQHEVKGKAMGMPFDGMGLTGYDNVKEEYNTLWIDSMGTAMMTGKGKFDESTQTLTDKGEFSCPIADDKEQDFRGEWKIIDKNNMVYALYSAGMVDDGPEFKNMEMIFKRVK